MRTMTKDETILYNILKGNKEARLNNYEACREFYWKAYGIDLPKLKEVPTIWTIERTIRTLKSLYRECSDTEADEIHAKKEEDIKESLIDDNLPSKMNYEQVEMKFYGQD